jgi:hypothetical protein
MMKKAAYAMLLLLGSSCATPPEGVQTALIPEVVDKLPGIHELWVNEDRTVTLVATDSWMCLFRRGKRVGRVTLGQGESVTLSDTLSVASLNRLQAIRTLTALCGFQFSIEDGYIRVFDAD